MKNKSIKRVLIAIGITLVMYFVIRYAGAWLIKIGIIGLALIFICLASGFVGYYVHKIMMMRSIRKAVDPSKINITGSQHFSITGYVFIEDKVVIDFFAEKGKGVDDPSKTKKGKKDHVRLF